MIPFTWGHEQQQAFDDLRERFLSAQIITQFDRHLETIMETDASNQAIAGILSQYHVVNGAKQLHPGEYHAKTLSASQRIWPIHDKELFAIVDCFRKWRDWLVGVHVNVYNHQGLQDCNTKQKLNCRQATWYLRMSEYLYNIHYRPGSKMGKPDGLSRRSGEEKSGMDARVFEDGQLMVLEDDEEDADDIKAEGIDIVGWENKVFAINIKKVPPCTYPDPIGKKQRGSFSVKRNCATRCFKFHRIPSYSASIFPYPSIFSTR